MRPAVASTSSAHIAEAYLRTSHAHQEFTAHTVSGIHYQQEALRISSRTLDLNVLAISDVYDAFAASARQELEKQAMLLEGLELDLVIVSKVRIHSDFLSANVRRAVEAGEKARTLGDYVSNVKMRQVAEGCAKVHSECHSTLTQEVAYTYS